MNKYPISVAPNHVPQVRGTVSPNRFRANISATGMIANRIVKNSMTTRMNFVQKYLSFVSRGILVSTPSVNDFVPR